jgi:alkylhydroperoxidase family enzyme
MLAFIEKLTNDPDAVGPADVAPLRAAGIADEAIEDAIHVCALFNIYDRLADSLGFALLPADVVRRQAGVLIARGYR